MPPPIPKYKLPWLPFKGPSGAPGPVGLKGNPGKSGGYASPSAITHPIVPPTINYRYRDEYKSDVGYDVYDVVQYDNALWVCTKSNINNVPSDSSLYWQHVGGQYTIKNNAIDRQPWI